MTDFDFTFLKAQYTANKTLEANGELVEYVYNLFVKPAAEAGNNEVDIHIEELAEPCDAEKARWSFAKLGYTTEIADIALGYKLIIKW